MNKRDQCEDYGERLHLEGGAGLDRFVLTAGSWRPTKKITRQSREGNFGVHATLMSLDFP